MGFIQALFDSKVKAYHEEKIRRLEEEDQRKKMEEIAEKLVKEEEEAKLANAAEEEDDMTPLDKTGTQMQDAFRRMLEKKMLEQFAKEKQQKELILSDEVKIKTFPWSYLKWEAMEDNFDFTHPDYDFSSSDQ